MLSTPAFLSCSSYPGCLLVRRRCAFTLIELLAVIAVMVVLVTLVTPALRPLFQSRGRAAALADLAAGVELAKTYAQTGRCYTWLAVKNTTRDGRGGVIFTIFKSRDGTPNTDLANIEVMTSAKFVPEVALAGLASLGEDVVGKVPSGAVDVTVKAGAFPTNTGSVNYSQGSESYTLTFTPGGEVLVSMTATPETPYDQYVALPLAAKPGGSGRAEELDAVLLIEGGSGQVKAIQL